MSATNPFEKEVSTYLELIRNRGPLTVWEIAAVVETEAFRIEDRLAPALEDGWIVTFETLGRTFLRLSDQEYDVENDNKPLLARVASTFNRTLQFESIPKRTAVKRTMTDICSYKKLINEAYILTRDEGQYSEEQRIKTNLIVERDIKKLKTLDEKKLYLADFIYEKSLGRKKNYFKKRQLSGED